MTYKANRNATNICQRDFPTPRGSCVYMRILKSRRYFTFPGEAFHNLTCLHGNILYIIIMSTIKLNCSCVIGLWYENYITYYIIIPWLYYNMNLWYRINTFQWYLNSGVNLQCRRHENLSNGEYYCMLFTIIDYLIAETS